MNEKILILIIRNNLTNENNSIKILNRDFKIITINPIFLIDFNKILKKIFKQLQLINTIKVKHPLLIKISTNLK